MHRVNNHAMSERRRRQQMIVDILTRGPVPNQEHLQDALGNRGLSATQATVSRDLRELGVAKGPQGYVILPGFQPQPEPTSAALEDAMRSYITSAEVGGTIVVLRTGPGHAQSVAIELDRTPPTGVVGTIAGDDTIFIACKSPSRASTLLRHIKKLAGLG